MRSRSSARGSSAVSFACLLVVMPLAAQESAAAKGLVYGPFVGHCDDDTIHLWARAQDPGDYTLVLTQKGRDDLPGGADAASEADGLALTFRVDGLRGRGSEPFGFRLLRGDVEVARSDAASLRTAMPDDAKAAKIAFGSCAEERKQDELPLWGHLLAGNPDALVLLGDTPYIDNTKLAVQRDRYREFYAHPSIAHVLRSVSTYATWDDHDYSLNDRYGDVRGRNESRQAFVENHALASFGENGEGIYTRFRRGPIEVFVLDARWFADTSDSPLAPGHRTLLGERQLEWLRRGLLASTAPFKVLCCGLVWNGAVRANKKDTWATWAAERDALFAFLGEHRIGGVVLVSGDLHVTRLLHHPTLALCGYDLPEFVTSPMSATPIPANAGAHDGDRFTAAVASTYLVLEATSATAEPRLSVRFCDAAGGRLHFASYALSNLQPATK
ncbi:MAG: alkaline phosphatase D family protein [Planctomycetota bacterium]